MPPNQILAGLAIFMTLVIMYPVGKAINDTAFQPYMAEEIRFDEMLDRAQKPIRKFMFKHTREKDLSIFYSITKEDRPKNKEEVNTLMLVAAYTIRNSKPALPSVFSSISRSSFSTWSLLRSCSPWA